MGVTQTLSTLQMHLITSESESTLMANEVSPSPNGIGYRIVGAYTNEPDVHLRGDRSEIHDGAFVIDTHGPPAKPETLTGKYWTDRGEAGGFREGDGVATIGTRRLTGWRRNRDEAGGQAGSSVASCPQLALSRTDSGRVRLRIDEAPIFPPKRPQRGIHRRMSP